MEEQMNI